MRGPYILTSAVFECSPQISNKCYKHVLPNASMTKCIIEMKYKIQYQTSIGRTSTDRTFSESKKLLRTKFVFVIIIIPHLCICLTQVKG